VTSGNTSNTDPSGTGTILDNDEAPTVTIGDVTVEEGEDAVFDVTLSNPSAEDVVIDVVTTTGTAGTDDYTETTITLTIPAGSTSTTVTVPTTDDVIEEPEEEFTLDGTITSGNTSNTTASGTGTITDNDGCIDLNIWVYLEGSLVNVNTGLFEIIENPGPGNPQLMRTTLNDERLLPGQVNTELFAPNVYNPGQPYSAAPWNYFGNEGDNYDSGGDENFADAGYPPTVVDWVLVSLRSDPQDGSEALCQRAGLLHNDGSIEFLPDAECCDLDINQDYYIVVEHRNHLIVMSHEAVPILNGGSLTYDFRFQDSYLFDEIGSGGFHSQKQVDPGKVLFSMYAGNGEQSAGFSDDTDINAADQILWYNDDATTRTYNFTDYNMSSDRDSKDFEVWQTNSPRNTTVPRN
jgi:hypothetical protein